MQFTIRPCRRIPVCCPVTCQHGNSKGYGTVQNLSRMGWQFSGNLPLREEKTRKPQVKAVKRDIPPSRQQIS